MMEYSVWTERYRPVKFEDLVFKEKNSLKKKLDNIDSMTHIILYSKSGGTGKGSIFNVIKNYLNVESSDVCVINASSDRGIDHIREVVNSFVSTHSMSGIRKLLFLDEVDGLTKTAFESLKNTMEKYHKNCLFVLSTNHIEKIPDQIISRCQRIDLKSPDKKDILTRLEYICKVENVEIEDKAMKKLISIHYPDMRSMVNMLQNVYDNGANPKITYDMIKTDIEKHKEIWDMVKKGQIQSSIKKWISENYDVEKMVYDWWKFFLQEYEDSNIDLYDNVCNKFEETLSNIKRGVYPDVCASSLATRISRLLVKFT